MYVFTDLQIPKTFPNVRNDNLRNVRNNFHLVSSKGDLVSSKQLAS